MDRFQEMSVLAVRASQLVPGGAPDFDNAEGALVLCDGISTFEFAHEIYEGEEFTEVDAGGKLCVSRKRDNAVKYTTFTLTLCSRSHAFDDLVGVAEAVRDDDDDIVGKIVNVAIGCSGAPVSNGVALELWSERWDCNAQADPNPFLRSVLPLSKLTPVGFTKENGVAKPVYQGFSLANPNFGDGPFGDLDDVVDEHDWCYGEFDDDALPTCPDPFDYVAIPAAAS